MTLYFELVEPITLNHAIQYRTQGRFVKAYKSEKYKQMIKYVDGCLTEPEIIKKLNIFNIHYNNKEHYLKADYRFYYPVLTKEGLVSKKSKDVSNIIKPIEDAIFNHLVVDDSQIVSTTVSKIHSKDIKVEVDLTVCMLNHLN